MSVADAAQTGNLAVLHPTRISFHPRAFLPSRGSSSGCRRPSPVSTTSPTTSGGLGMPLNQMWRSISPELWTQYRNPVEMLSAVDPATWKALEATARSSRINTPTRFAGSTNTWTPTDTWWDRHHADSHRWSRRLPVRRARSAQLNADLLRRSGRAGRRPHQIGIRPRACRSSPSGCSTGGAISARRSKRPATSSTCTPSSIRHACPVLPVAGRGGQLKVEIEFPGRTVLAAVWKMQVGRVPILLLDTDIPDNADADRPITHMLYVRGSEMRFAQEYILGIGAVRALKALDIKPATWHVNEGHAAMSSARTAGRRGQIGRLAGRGRSRPCKPTPFSPCTPRSRPGTKFSKCRWSRST